MHAVTTQQQITGDKYRFTVLTPSLIRMEYSESGQFEDGLTQVVINRQFPEFEFKVIDYPDRLDIVTEFLHVHYNKQPFSGGGLYVELLKSASYWEQTWHYGQDLDTLKGTARTLDGVNGAIPLGDGLVSRTGFSILDDSESLLLDNAANDGQGAVKPRPIAEQDFYFFGYQDRYLEALHDYYVLTGFPPLVPRFALGNWWSRYWPYTEQSFTQLMDKFRDWHIPLSTVCIDMDWHLVDIPAQYGNGWTGYSWNKKLFPDPPKFLQSLHDDGLKVALNVHPASGVRAYEDAYPRMAKRLGLDTKNEQPADFNLIDPNFLKAYFEDLHHPLEDEGVDFWWIDWQQGTETGQKGIDPLWLLNYYHYNDSVRRHGQDALILSRYAGPGSHRYPIGFSGDTWITWDSLQFQPYFTATASNIGYGWWSNDIGGHMAGQRDEELELRWMQLGVFSPINRLHSSSSLFINKEPWTFSAPYDQYIVQALQARHRLLPYLYTHDVRAHEEGIPLILPAYYQEPGNDEAYQVPNEYFFGEKMLVAPVTTKQSPEYQMAKTSVWLPKGTWYDFYHDWAYQGDTTLDVYRALNETPVFVPAGAVIPLTAADEATQFGAALPETIEWHVFPGSGQQHFTLVEDQDGQRCTSTVTVDWTTEQVTLTVEGDTAVLPSNRQHVIVFHGGAVAADSTDQAAITAGQSLSFIGFPEDRTDDLQDEALRRIKAAWTSTQTKENVWRIMQGDGSLPHKLNALRKAADPFFVGMMYELLYCQESQEV